MKILENFRLLLLSIFIIVISLIFGHQANACPVGSPQLILNLGNNSLTVKSEFYDCNNPAYPVNAYINIYNSSQNFGSAGPIFVAGPATVVSYTFDVSALKSGTYTASVQAINPDTQASETLTQDFVIDRGSCSPSTQTVNIGQTASLSVPTGLGVTYSWSAAGGSPASGGGTSFSTSYSSSGTKTVTLTDSLNDVTNCTVIVNAAPVPLSCSISTPTGGSYLVKNNIDFDAANASGGVSPYTYSWNFGDGNTGSGQSIKHQYNDSLAGTNPNITLTVKDSANNTCSSSGQISLFIDDMNLDAAVYPNTCGAGSATAMASNDASQVTINRTKPNPGSPDTVNLGINPIYRLGTYGLSIGSYPDTYTFCSLSPSSLTYDSLTSYSKQTATAFFVPKNPGGNLSCVASFSPSSAQSAGGSTTFSITSSNATNPASYKCVDLSNKQIGSGSISLDASGNGSVSLSADQTKICTATVTDSSGNTNTCNSQFTLPPPAPTGVSGTASCSGATSAQADISWSPSLGADSYIVYQVGGGFLGLTDSVVGTTNGTSLTVQSLNLSTKYEFYVVAKNSVGSSANSSTISVTTPSSSLCSASSVTAHITATPSSISSGQSSNLHWWSTGATSCSSSDFLTGGATSGYLNVFPASTKTYNVNCTDGTNNASNSATVTVTGVSSGLSCALSSDTNTPPNISATVTGGSGSYNCYWSGVPNSAFITNCSNVPSGCSSGTCQISAVAKDLSSGLMSPSCNITINGPPPTGNKYKVYLNIQDGLNGGQGPLYQSGNNDLGFVYDTDSTISTALIVPYGYQLSSYPIILSWSTYNAGNCIATSSTGLIQGWSGPVADQSNGETNYINVPNYGQWLANAAKITCDKIGSQGSVSAVMEADIYRCSKNDPNPTCQKMNPASCTFTAYPSAVLYGQKSTLTWSCDVPPNSKCSIDQNVGSVSPNGTTKVAPTKDTTYNLTCTGTPPVAASTIVKVGYLPVIREIIPR